MKIIKKIIRYFFDKSREPFGIYRSKQNPNRFIKVKPLGINGILVRKKGRKK